MKVTIEIPNFEIWPNNDETPTDFISEVREQVVNAVSQMVIKQINSNNAETKLLIQQSIARVENESINKLDELIAFQEEEINKTIKGLKSKK